MTAARTLIAEIGKVEGPSGADDIDPFSAERRARGVDRARQPLKVLKVKGHALTEDDALEANPAAAYQTIDVRLACNGGILVWRSVDEASADGKRAVVSMGSHACVTACDQREGGHASSSGSKSCIKGADEGWEGWR